jgi:hypothetical protein
MALTPLRWAAIAVAGMLIVVAAAMTLPAPPQPTPNDLERSRLSHAEGTARLRLNRFARHFRVARLSDSLRRALPHGDARPVRLVFGRDVSDVARAAVNDVVLRAQQALGAPAAGVDVVTLMDTMPIAGYRIGNGLNPFYMLPTSPAERCTVVLPIGSRNGANVIGTLRTDEASEQILGPCGYYAAFGQAGNGVRAWLLDRGAALAFGGSWTRRPEHVSVPFARTGVYDDVLNPALDVFSLMALRCANGETAECQRAILDGGHDSRLLAVGNSVMSLYPIGPIWRRNGVAFGSRDAEILAGMVRSLGREKFAAFWTSSEPVPVAFENAAGVSLGDWTSSWANEQIDPLEHGPTAPPIVMFEAILIVLLGLAASVVAARRRQFA